MPEQDHQQNKKAHYEQRYHPAFHFLTQTQSDHSVYDYAKIVEQSKIVVDTRNACEQIKSNKIIKA